MKPRTKLQVRVLKLSNRLDIINNEMLQWAIKYCLKHEGFMTKNRVLCMDCGNSFSPGIVRNKKAVCPHCSSKLAVKASKCRTLEQDIYVAKAQIYEEFQIVRNYKVYSRHKAGQKAKYGIYEILQHWIIPGGKREVIARNHSLNYYVDSWNGDMEIRNKSFDWRGNKYDVYPEKIHPKSQFMPEFSKIGISHNLQEMTLLEAIMKVPNDSKLETLIKCKQYSLLFHFRDKNIHQYWTAIKICIRNKYFVKDVQMWVDYIDLLNYFNKDLHNAYYVCPKNLKKSHDKLVKKKRDEQNRKRIAELRRKLKEDQEEYVKLRGSIFGFRIADGDLIIKPIESVEECMNEGDLLKHCVFTNEYYKKEESLILSARVDDKPIETIEVSLRHLKVVQSRGMHNKPSPYHEKIVDLVHNNIKEIAKKLKTKKHVQRKSDLQPIG